jgi:acyl-CoA synthetase (AMP-forming)/AMP-acid ligase II
MATAFNLGSLLDPNTPRDRIAVIDCRDWQSPAMITHGALDDRASAFARGLVRKGLQRGDAVAILADNSADYLAAYLGIMRAGLVAVPVNPRLSRETISFIVKDAVIKLAVVDPHYGDGLPAGLATVRLADDRLASLLDVGPFEAVVPAPHETAMILYTSGSSGQPKGVPLSHQAHLWAIASRVAKGGHDHERLMIAAPFFHMNGLGAAKFVIAAGASAVILPRFDVRHFIEAIGRFKVTWLTGVPTMFALMVREAELLSATDLSSVRYVRLGSAPASQKLIEDIRTALPRASFSIVYGTTESGPIAFGPHPQGWAKPDTALGWPLRGVEARFVGEDDGTAREGILMIRTPANMRGYLNLPERTGQVLTPDGWYITGDVMTRDERGCYAFAGRSDDMINCGGENIFPAEVERLLERHPAVEEAAVIALPDEIKGEKPVAFIVLKPGHAATEDEIKAFALANAPAFQHPRRVMSVERLPWAGTNKIDRKALRALAERSGWLGDST